MWLERDSSGKRGWRHPSRHLSRGVLAVWILFHTGQLPEVLSRGATASDACVRRIAQDTKNRIGLKRGKAGTGGVRMRLLQKSRRKWEGSWGGYEKWSDVEHKIIRADRTLWTWEYWTWEVRFGPVSSWTSSPYSSSTSAIPLPSLHLSRPGSTFKASSNIDVFQNISWPLQMEDPISPAQIKKQMNE